MCTRRPTYVSLRFSELFPHDNTAYTIFSITLLHNLLVHADGMKSGKS